MDKNAGTDTFAKRVRALRMSLGLTQQAFADKLKIARNTVAKYEYEARVPEGPVTELICRQFGVNRDWLVNGTGEMYAKKSRKEEISAFLQEALADESDSFRARLVDALARLTVEDWKQVERLAEKMGISVGDTPQPEPAEPRTVHDWTDAEVLDAVRRDLDAEKRAGGGSSTSFCGGSGTA